MAKIPTPLSIPASSIWLPDPDAAEGGFVPAQRRVVARRCGSATWELLWGRGALQAGSAALLEAWVVECSDTDAKALQGADTGPTVDWVTAAEVCALLRAAGLPNLVVAGLLCTTPANVSRLTRLSDSCDLIRQCIRRGHLTPGHGRILAALPREQQEHWTRQALGHRWSVRSLEAALADAKSGLTRQAAPDTSRFLDRLGEALGTRAELTGGHLRLACYSAEEAKGLMERLAQGPEVQCLPASAAMWLSVPAPDYDQLYALTGHLVPSE
ncbi:ParB/RepB/Spo0J family partition protein [Pseudoxanthomonas kaohsiungensis]|uniref:ParB/RepB/Spo0J family partition protein n=1 Tax=Pseudoxanthomonas kaohsiungensis TaxID=283923 RepID=A0ABW3LZM8_9GAMM|nr:hypothetical protein [Pseudoxanthomonas kaohsiungensis]KAF1702965.1 hypothetical protein CSC66_09325 [Pseudoxanthomonas kaohsiungensis]